MDGVTTTAPRRTPDLIPGWVAAVRAGGGSAGEPRVREEGERLVRRWDEPHRRYHDLAHLADVLAALDLLAPPATSVALQTVPAKDDDPRVAAVLAAWFHDAVYLGQPGADEEASAVLAEEVLPRLGVPIAVVTEVARLVRLTATHDPAPDDRAGALLVDADLAVLAGGPEDYARYTAAIRQEYAHVPEPMFRARRAAVLEALLDKPFLYRTAGGQARWEGAARANLRSEIAALRASGA